MAIPLKALLFLGGASTAALGTAYVAGAFDPQPVAPAGIAQPITAPAAPAAAAPEAKPAEQQVAAAAPQPDKPAAATEAPAPIPPAFDLLRVEPNGSMVIAGKAMPGSTVEALAGSKLIGKTDTSSEGDFAIVLDEPLKPGDYQIVLRSTGPGTVVLNSVETAVVSVPATPDGQVLALVEQPGAPSKLITATPTPEPAAAPAQVAVQPPAAAAPAPAAPVTQPPPVVIVATVQIEAVEIDGRKVFVAGAAPAGSMVRGYANEILLGDAKTSPEGRFLIEAERDLPVGDYIVRVDHLSPNGDKVIARATVPFKREAGEAVAAVAPAPKPAEPAAAPAAAPAQPEPQAPAPAPAAVATPPAAPAPEAQPVEVATAPQLEASAAGVVIRRGDTLWRISKRVYGKGTRYSTIYTANKGQIADPNRIWPGQVFKVPGKSDQGEAADMEAMQDQATTVQ